MRQRAHQSPQVAPPGQERQVLTDLDARRARGDRPELAADGLGRGGFWVEAVVLSQAAGKEDVDTRLGFAAGSRGSRHRFCFDSGRTLNLEVDTTSDSVSAILNLCRWNDVKISQIFRTRQLRISCSSQAL